MLKAVVHQVRRRSRWNWKVYLAVISITFFIIGLFRQHLISWQAGNSRPDSSIVSNSPGISNSSIVTLSGDSAGKLDGQPLIKYVENNWFSLNQQDDQLIQYTRMRHLTPPSNLKYNFPKQNHRDEFSSWVASFFKNKRNGIFIEAGANEGVAGSHSLYLEEELGWTGLLVECNANVVKILRSKERKAWIADVCLSPTPNPGKLNFSEPIGWTASGTLGKQWNVTWGGKPIPHQWRSFEVQAIPLYTILAALELKQIDYFSLDVEGQEMAVLKYFPFHLVTFKILIVEIWFYSESERQELNDLLISNGYTFVKDIDVDKVYVHNSVKHMIPSQ